VNRKYDANLVHRAFCTLCVFQRFRQMRSLIALPSNLTVSSLPMTHLLALIPYPNIDKDMVRLGPIRIRWYGMAYLTGFVLGFWVLSRLSKNGFLRISLDWLGDLVGWLALGVVVGGRAGWWIFYHNQVLASEHPESWWEPIAIWHGGMSFHGGLVGVILVLWVWSRYRKVSFLNLADCLALVAPLGLCLGRIANFINGELVGRPTNVPWAMIFPGYPEPRHPSQLYESFLEGPVLLAVVWLVKWRRNRRDGQIAAAFVVGYALFRFLVEFTRQPDDQLGFIAFGWLTMGQLLSFLIGIVGIIWWIILSRKQPTEVEHSKK
jgi:phosphatidylglycerol:prolipoprotein diacylglycerol transferase